MWAQGLGSSEDDIERQSERAEVERFDMLQEDIRSEEILFKQGADDLWFMPTPRYRVEALLFDPTNPSTWWAYRKKCSEHGRNFLCG